jgi:hypothetical protein
MSGHLHRYGVELMLEDVTAEEVLLVTRPDQVAEDGRILSMPQHTFYLRGGLRIYADHVYRITAVYDNPTSDTFPIGAMGTIGGVIRAAEKWPKPELDHPDYIKDMRVLHSHERLEHAHEEVSAAQAREWPLCE